MSSKEYLSLVRAGFSESFLRTTAGSHPSARHAIAGNPESWRTCSGCKKKFADIRSIQKQILNGKGADLRRAANQPFFKIGCCSMVCAKTHYQATDTDISRIAKAVVLGSRPDFYESKEWRALRYEVLEERKGRCDCCGRTAHDGTKIHVDHIKPRFYHPHLSLDKTNLQILCEDCNLGKGALYETDWRKKAK